MSEKDSQVTPLRIALIGCGIMGRSLGDSVAVAVKHYLQVTEDHFKQATKKATHNPTHCLHQTAAIPPELQRVIEAWPSLPATMRRGIMAMVEEMRRE